MSGEILDKKTWTSYRPGLNNSYTYDDRWEKVISLFKKRIDNFYFDPIELILKPKSTKGEGFAILTLQCALIEMLAAFKSGQIYTQGQKIYNYEYKKSGKFFKDFLHTEAIFENYFFSYDAVGNKVIDHPYNASEFYDRVRCGLMHEARTKLDWRITANPKKMSSQSGFIGKDKFHNKIIHRTNLHLSLKNYFENSYLVQLRAQNNTGIKLRRFLGRKLDHLHDFPSDLTFDWWQDR